MSRTRRKVGKPGWPVHKVFRLRDTLNRQFIIGLAQKVLIADFIAAIIDPALANYRQLGTWTAWACMLGYSYQLYFDFAGYSKYGSGAWLPVRNPHTAEFRYAV